MRIYTRSGDRGDTGLVGGDRVGKEHVRIEAVGAIDEFNASIGIARHHPEPALDTWLTGIQHDLFDLGGEMAIPGSALLNEKGVGELEAAIDHFNAPLGPLKEFLLPGGTRAAALAHLARAVCRRAERRLVAVAATESISGTGRQYVNRLSDLLFVLGRSLNRAAGRGDVLWQKDRARG